MSNAYVDPWDMVNNFRFHVYVQKSLFILYVKIFRNVFSPLFQETKYMGPLDPGSWSIDGWSHLSRPLTATCHSVIVS